MNGLPQNYLSALHLPFNRHCLEAQFQLQSPDQDPGGPGYWLALQGSRLVVASAPGDEAALPEERTLFDQKAPPLYIGLWDGRPCRLVELPRQQPLTESLAAISFMEENPQLPIALLTLAGLGRMILHWERNSCYCAGCGQPMSRLSGAWGKNCPSCRAHHFPHIHPCAIILVRRPGEVLLTRKPNWAPNRYSLVAGFTEFGECLEETAAREVREETGVAIRNVHYLGSQCWPFPSQLMCGFVAEYAGGDILVDRSELDDARWFRVDDLPTLPPKRSIARYILDTGLKIED
jgi:NAD+ diphosphatase